MAIGSEPAEQWYKLMTHFPKEEFLRLTRQIRRSAASIPANIAEDHGRRRTKEIVCHQRIARRSLTDLKHISGLRNSLQGRL